MIRIYQGILFVILILQGFCHLEAGSLQEQEEPYQSYQVGELSESFLEKYLNDKDFIYEYDTAPVQPESFWRKLWNFIKSIFSEDTAPVLGILFRIILIGLIVLFLFILISKTRLFKIMQSEEKAGTIPYQIDPLFDSGIDLEELIAREIEKGNYRNAIRYLFIKTVKTLETKNVIQFTKDKTNSDFRIEIKNEALKRIFSELTRTYEYVWYGNFAINKADFKTYSKQVNDCLIKTNVKVR